MDTWKMRRHFAMAALAIFLITVLSGCDGDPFGVKAREATKQQELYNRQLEIDNINRAAMARVDVDRLQVQLQATTAIDTAREETEQVRLQVTAEIAVAQEETKQAQIEAEADVAIAQETTKQAKIAADAQVQIVGKQEETKQLKFRLDARFWRETGCLWALAGLAAIVVFLVVIRPLLRR